MKDSIIVDIDIKGCSMECILFNRWRMVDNITNLKATLTSGMIYVIVGDFGNGGWALSYLLAGKGLLLELNNDLFKINGVIATQKSLQNIACYIGEGVAEAPFKTRKAYPNKIIRKFLGIKTVAQRIEEGINQSGSKYKLNEIANLFDLTGIAENDERNGRIHRPLEYQSNEVWRASMAIGFAFGKKLFCCPWMQGGLYSNYIIGEYNRKYIQILKEHNAIVLIPVMKK